jgi:hypothetical protein
MGRAQLQTKFIIYYQEEFRIWQRIQLNEYTVIKDTIYIKLALMPWIDDNLGHTLSGLTQIGNIIAKIFIIFTIFQVHYRFLL